MSSARAGDISLLNLMDRRMRQPGLPQAKGDETVLDLAREGVMA